MGGGATSEPLPDGLVEEQWRAIDRTDERVTRRLMVVSGFPAVKDDAPVPAADMLVVVNAFLQEASIKVRLCVWLCVAVW